MICKGCGKEISENQFFCPSCGHKNEVSNGVKNTKRCIKCAKEFPEERFYCDVCGGDLAPIMPAQEPVPNQGVPTQGYNTPYSAQTNQVPPYQTPPRQVPPYQVPPNQVPPNRMPQNMVPPMAPYQSNAQQKNKALLPILLGVAGLFVIIVGFFIVSKVLVELNSSGDLGSYQTTDNSDNDSNTEEDTSTYSANDGTYDSTTDATTDDTSGDYIYTDLYSYTELPDVYSLDSDTRFSYYNNSSYDGISTYVFQLNDTSLSESDFYTAVDDYCTLLVNNNSFYYEEEFTNEQYNETGDLTEYLSRDNVCVSVTASVEDTGYYAYVSIFPLNDSTESITFKNYTTYIDGRDNQYFDEGTEVIMDNGMAFYLNDVVVTDMGDGSAVLDAYVDLATINSERYFYPDDLIVLPKDSYGNILSDACLVEYITDGDGYSVTTPFLLDTEYYNSYKVSFVVPSGTTTFSIYGTNITEDSYAGPIYYIDMQLE
ncbi:MAG: hypothetical protein PHF63_01315 [Herbinix sp.]|nr:hypothetical protein [Herbinix sp.]